MVYQAVKNVRQPDHVHTRPEQVTNPDTLHYEANPEMKTIVADFKSAKIDLQTAASRSLMHPYEAVRMSLLEQLCKHDL